MLWYDRLSAWPPAPVEKITISGTVQFVEPLYNKQRIILRADEPRPVRNARLFIYTERYPLRPVGSLLQFECVLEKPVAFDAFAYDIYAARNSIAYVCRYPAVTQLPWKHGIRSYLFALKEWYSRSFRISFHEPENGLAQAMVLARAGELSQPLRTEFSRAGIVHVISISGLHMALLTMLLEVVLQAFGLGRRVRFSMLALFSFFYLMILGFPPPAVRSAIMVLLLLFARIIGRPSEGTHILLLVATLMVVQNPYLLGFDIGFQLSFAALAGIMLTNEWWERVLRFVPERFAFRSVTAMTCAAQLFTWPLSAYYFGMFSLVAPFANIAVAALLGPVLVGALVAPFALAVPFAAPFVVWPTFFMLRGLVVAAHYASRVPMAVLPLPSHSLSLTIVSYALMGIVYLHYARKRKIHIRSSTLLP
ncbi:MAG: ComEC/Rec2 family competence protein [Candidatus Komeilibacteria bacterium]|nr:ComEC/Rec2 family competence protein [Candidatus Komeilibacteria bacterium]